MTVAVGVPSAQADSTVVIEGRGFGHGVGMAQDGAYWLGLSGRSATEILRTFFPGTVLAKKAGTVRVSLGSGSNFTISFPAGGLINGTRVPAGRTVTVSARDGEVVATIASETAPTAPEADEVTPVSVGMSGGRGFSVAALPSQSSDPAVIPLTTAPPITTTTQVTTTVPAATPEPATTVPPSETPTSVPGAGTPGEPGTPGSPVEPNPETGDAAGDGAPQATSITTRPTGPVGVTVRGSTLEAAGSSTVGYGGRRYRGSLELRFVGGTVRVVNVVDIEDYLRGMGEILTPSWPAATLQAQAIAARTYALRYMAASGEICPTQRCQVYLGAQAEYPAMDKAVAATRSKVLVYEGKLIAAFYSASGGGTIATPKEAFGGDVDIPYLRAGAYPTGDLKAWTVRMSLGEIARRVGYRGSPSSIAITEVGPSGRALTVTIYGSAGTLNVRGPSFDAALGLKSTFFTFGAGSSGAVVAGTGSNASADASTDSVPSGGQVAGPVGPRIPVVVGDGDASGSGDPDDSAVNDAVTGDVLTDDAASDVLFAQSDLLTMSDAASGDLAPDADRGPDDTLSAESSTPVTEEVTGASAVDASESSLVSDDSSVGVDEPNRQALPKQPANEAGGGAPIGLIGGTAAVVVGLVAAAVASARRRRNGPRAR